MLRRTILAVTALMLSVAVVSTAGAQDYDLVIKNGRVMDPETMFDSVANVGIKDGRIAVITKKDVQGNPLEDIKAVTNRDNLKIIMKDGVIYKNTLD